MLLLVEPGNLETQTVQEVEKEIERVTGPLESLFATFNHITQWSY